MAQVARTKPCQRCQRPQPPRKAQSTILRALHHRRQAPPRKVAKREPASRFGKSLAFAPKQLRAHNEQCLAACADRLRVTNLIEQGCPSPGNLGKVAAGYAKREQLCRSGLQARLGGHRAAVEPIERIAPPSHANRPERRLGGSRNHLTERIIDSEQGVKGGT